MAAGYDDPGVRRAQRYSPRPLTDGERWTASALGDLRRRGYRPRAWWRFVRAALQRSGEDRRARPVMARQAGACGVGGAAAWLAFCAAARNREAVAPRPVAGLAWWALVWQMLDWHLGMAEGGDGIPRERLAPADAVTLARFWLVPVLPAVAGSRVGLPAVVALGGATDWADGALARRRGRTRLGRDLDTTADLAFVATAALSAHRAGRLSSAALGALVARQVVGVGLSAAAVLSRSRRPAARARPWGGGLRVGGLTLAAAGAPRIGGAMVVLGAAVPPRRTARHRSAI